MKKITYMLMVCILLGSMITVAYDTGATNDTISNTIFENFSEEYGTSKIKQKTLLVLKYKKLNINDITLKNLSVDDRTLEKFVKLENKRRERYNKKLQDFFEKYYDFPYKIISEENLERYPPEVFPYIYKRNIDTKNGINLSYTRFFEDRKENISFQDIYLFSHSARERVLVDKDIIKELNYFLME